MIGRLYPIVLAGVLATSCRISRSARFYTLTSVAAPAVAHSNLLIVVEPVSIPGTVDRSEMVLTTGTNERKIDEFHRWTSSLQDNLARVVAQELSSLLGTPRVVLSAAATSAEPDVRVSIEVLRFESSLGRFAALDAVWTLRPSGKGPPATGRTSVREHVEDDSYQALAAAHSRAVAQMSRQIADQIVARVGSDRRTDGH